MHCLFSLATAQVASLNTQQPSVNAIDLEQINKKKTNLIEQKQSHVHLRVLETASAVAYCNV